MPGIKERAAKEPAQPIYNAAHLLASPHPKLTATEGKRLGPDSPEQPDLTVIGPASAQGGCERQRAQRLPVNSDGLLQLAGAW